MQKVSYMGNGTTTEFTFNFPYYENSNIIVTKNGTTATGYSIVGTSGGLDADIPYTGGKIVFETAPSPLDNITISRQLTLTRVADYQPTEKIEPTTLNQDINYVMEILKDFQDEFTTLHTQYSEIADKDSTSTLLSRISAIDNKIDAVNSTITNFDSQIENGRIMSKDDFYSYTTNCITEIPQDIKLELNNGTLTLKAGSKIYVPNGNGVFNVVTVSTDRSVSRNQDGKYFIYGKSDGSSVGVVGESSVYSGSTDPNHQWCIWYDTANNLVKKIEGTAGVVAYNCALPFGIVTVSNGAISSIDMVFNGFGYIGSTLFALPGVSGLIPAGRNPDGTLKNYKYSLTTVNTRTVSGSGWIALSKNQTQMGWLNGTWQLTNDNYLLWDGTKRIDADRLPIAYEKYENGQISAVNFRTVFSSTDRNDATFVEIS